MEDHSKLLYYIEVHSLEGLNQYFENGGDPNAVFNGVPLFTTMVEMYLRSPRFKECVRIFINHGLDFADQALLAVLSDNAEMLKEELSVNAKLIHQRYFAFKNTFTSLEGATLLHYCAEYNHVECAKVLLQYGADVNAKAEVDENGFGGHTPIFHAVAQNNNNSLDALNLFPLLLISAKHHIVLRGLIPLLFLIFREKKRPYFF